MFGGKIKFTLFFSTDKKKKNFKKSKFFCNLLNNYVSHKNSNYLIFAIANFLQDIYFQKNFYNKKIIVQI